MPPGGARGQNLGHLQKCFFLSFVIILPYVDSRPTTHQKAFIFDQFYHAVLALIPVRLRTLMFMSRVGLVGHLSPGPMLGDGDRGQYLVHIECSLFFFRTVSLHTHTHTHTHTAGVRSNVPAYTLQKSKRCRMEA